MAPVVCAEDWYKLLGVKGHGQRALAFAYRILLHAICAAKGKLWPRRGRSVWAWLCSGCMEEAISIGFMEGASLWGKAGED